MAKKSSKTIATAAKADPVVAEKPKQEKLKKSVAKPVVVASLANAFAQSAAFFGKKESYAAPEVVEAPTTTNEVESDEIKPVTGQPETVGEKKPKKKKKEKKRKLAELEQSTDAATSGESDKDKQEMPVTDGDGDDEAKTLPTDPSNKSDRTIFVGNVSLDATQSSLKSFFSVCGKVETVRLRFMPVAGTAVNDHGNQKLVMKVCANQKIFTDKRDFCHAYVTFADKEGVEKAMLRNRSLFLNKTLRIDHENPIVDPQRSVFVGNLSFHITDEAVWSFFDKQLKTEDEPLPVENVRVVRDRESGAGKGFGYVLLKGKALAARALSLAGKKLQNRELRVQVCGKRTKNKKGEDAALKHEGRRASGAAARIVTKKKARGELVLPPTVKRAKQTEDKKPRAADGKVPASAKKPFAGKKGASAGSVGKGKKPTGTGKPLRSKGKKVSGLAPGVKPKKPKHAARKARQAAEAAAAAKGKL